MASLIEQLPQAVADTLNGDQPCRLLEFLDDAEIEILVAVAGGRAPDWEAYTRDAVDEPRGPWHVSATEWLTLRQRRLLLGCWIASMAEADPSVLHGWFDEDGGA